MPKKVYTWAKVKKRSAEKIPDALKTKVKTQADALIENVLKQKFILPPPEDSDFNYIVDIFGKWYRKYFYFCSKYNCPSPHAMSPFFESKFARLEYIGPDKFNLSYMRHTNQWFEIGFDMSLNECMKAIEEDNHFYP
jgi:hypothetical protein